MLRQLIHQVALMAGREVPKEQEDQIVKAIINNNMPADFGSLSKMFKNKYEKQRVCRVHMIAMKVWE